MLIKWINLNIKYLDSKFWIHLMCIPLQIRMNVHQIPAGMVGSVQTLWQTFSVSVPVDGRAKPARSVSRYNSMRVFYVYKDDPKP